MKSEFRVKSSNPRLQALDDLNIKIPIHNLQIRSAQSLENQKKKKNSMILTSDHD